MPRATTRTTKPRNSPARWAAAIIAVAVIAACQAPPRVGPIGDVADGPKLARDASDVLLRFAAYDYGLAGTLAGEKTRLVDIDRYASAARQAVRSIDTFRSSATASAANAAGPVRDHLLSLADGFTELGKDATAYADGADPAVFARVVDDVNAGWSRLDLLLGILPKDDATAKSVARGRSFVVNVKAERQYALTLGPFATAAEADAAVTRIGKVESVARTSPFIVRVGTYPDRPAADAVATTLAAKGYASSRVGEEPRFVFTRGTVAPDVELWREPTRVIDTYSGSRRVSISPDGAWIATGADDGTVAIFGSDGKLWALPRFAAGVSQMLFSDDGRWLLAGGTTLSSLSVPGGTSTGIPVRLPAPATQMAFVPSARAFVVASKGPTGLPPGGGGLIAGRAPDGFALGAPFPLTTPAAGSAFAPTDAGELFIATTTAGSTDVEVFRVGLEPAVRRVVRVAGTVKLLALDRTGTRGAVMTDQGVFRFGPRDTDPPRTVTRIGSEAREIAFGLDGTFYVLEATRLVAYDASNQPRSTIPLVDPRRLVIALRPLVVDGADRLLAVAADGSTDELGVGGTIQDVTASPDGRRVAVLVEGRRAVLFTMP